MDSITDKILSIFKKNLSFRSKIYNLKPKGYFFDVTNVYFMEQNVKLQKGA